MLTKNVKSLCTLKVLLLLDLILYLILFEENSTFSIWFYLVKKMKICNSPHRALYMYTKKEIIDLKDESRNESEIVQNSFT